VPSAITEFPLPPSATGAAIGASSVTAGPDGNVWFTDPTRSAVGRITPAGEVTEFSTVGNAAGAITTGPDGNLWFTGDALGGEIGRITPTGQVTEFTLPNEFAQLTAVTAGPDGNVWFTADIYPTGELVGRITPTGQITEFSIPVPAGVSGRVFDITAGPDGNLWFLHDGVLAQITPSGQITDHVADAVGTSIAKGPDGNIWTAGTLFNTQTGDILGGFVDRISLAGSVTTFSLGGAENTPGSIRTGPDGNLYFTEPSANQIGRITTDGQITLFAVPTAASQPTGITAGPNGNIWFTESGRQLGELFLTGTPPAAAAPTSTALTADVAVSAVGQTVHLTATVTSTGGAPTGGTVTFFDGTQSIGTSTVDAGGHAVLATAFPTSGNHTLSAVFNGTGDLAPSGPATFAETVEVAPTTTTLTASANPAPVGHKLVLTVAVTPEFTGAGTPTGLIELKDGNSVIAIATLDSSGHAVFTFIPGQTVRNGHTRTTILPRGIHHLTAQFEGDGNFALSTSVTLNLTVV
jgi:streptogramin lyase